VELALDAERDLPAPVLPWLVAIGAGACFNMAFCSQNVHACREPFRGFRRWLERLVQRVNWKILIGVSLGFANPSIEATENVYCETQKT
jgi:hypothetical protein